MTLCRKWFSIALLISLVNWSNSFGQQERTVVYPKDNGAALENPGMGWFLHYYDNSTAAYGSRLAPSDTLDDFPGLTAIYMRLPWSYIEPNEGQFNWSVVDGPSQRWIDKGKKVTFCFTCCESWLRYATPEWVKKAGAKGYYFDHAKGLIENGPCWEPDYDDPIFMEKLDKFLAAAAARYDGNPDVAFIDMGSFGVWGEGHTYWSTRLAYPASTICRHIDLHLKHFKKTLLAANDDFSLQVGKDTADTPKVVKQKEFEQLLPMQMTETIDYAFKKGMTLRDDSILVNGGKNAYFHEAMAQPFWPRLPVILESDHFGGSRDRGAWGDGSRYLQAVEDYHASYASIHWWPREFLAQNRELVNQINMKLGYRLQLVEASWPAEITVGSNFTFTSKWRNAGVAPCLPGGYIALTLKDGKGGIISVSVDEQFDVKDLPVGAPGQAQIRNQEAAFAISPHSHSGYGSKTIEPGIYEVYISIGTRIGTPHISLPLPECDGKRRYHIGTVKIVSDKSK